MIHWSLIATMAMYQKGMTLRVSRNPVMKSFTCGLDIAFQYLNEMFLSTKPMRRSLLALQKILNHSSDKYNCYHEHGLQVGPKAGVMHTNMV